MTVYIRFLKEEPILNPSQVGFRRNCSIWIAHANFETCIRQAMTLKQGSGSVTLDIKTAYHTLEHSTLQRTLIFHVGPTYVIVWIQSFLLDGHFFCTDGNISSRPFAQLRGIPRGSVLSPFSFNIVMSSLPMSPSISTIE